MATLELIDDRFQPGFACDASLELTLDDGREISLLLGDTYLHIYSDRYKQPGVTYMNKVMDQWPPIELKDYPVLAAYGEEMDDLITDLNAIETHDDDGELIEEADEEAFEKCQELVRLVERFCEDEEVLSLIVQLA